MKRETVQGDPDREVLTIITVTGGGTGAKGQIGFVDCQGANGEKLRLGFPSDDLPKLIGNLFELQGACYQEQLKHGAATTAQPQIIKKVERYETGIDHDQSAVVLSARHPDKSVTSVPIHLDDLPKILKSLREAMNQLKKQPKRKPH